MLSTFLIFFPLTTPLFLLVPPTCPLTTLMSLNLIYRLLITFYQFLSQTRLFSLVITICFVSYGLLMNLVFLHLEIVILLPVLLSIHFPSSIFPNLITLYIVQAISLTIEVIISLVLFAKDDGYILKRK